MDQLLVREQGRAEKNGEIVYFYVDWRQEIHKGKTFGIRITKAVPYYTLWDKEE